MAEPLSAFDMARVRWGWGTSSDPAERQRFAEAGLSPLTSEERMRMERGWGASPLASKESREAIVAEEVRRGDRPAWQLPEAYGGRPTGTTRRAIRQQQAWEAEQAAILQQQQEMRQMAEFQRVQEARAREEARSEYRYNKEIEADISKQKLDTEIEKQGAIYASGLRQLDPTSPDYFVQRTELQNNNILALIDPKLKELTNQYDEVNAIYASRAEKMAQLADADAKAQAQLRADIVTYGISPEQQAAMLESDLPAGVVRFDPLKALPVIAEAKQKQEAAKEEKVEEKETKKKMASKEDAYQKALAEYTALEEAGLTPKNSDVAAKAMAEARSAAAVLGLPKVNSEEDLKKYNSGDRVLAPDGITIITIP